MPKKTRMYGIANHGLKDLTGVAGSVGKRSRDHLHASGATRTSAGGELRHLIKKNNRKHKLF